MLKMVSKVLVNDPCSILSCIPFLFLIRRTTFMLQRGNYFPQRYNQLFELYSNFSLLKYKINYCIVLIIELYSKNYMKLILFFFCQSSKFLSFWNQYPWFSAMKKKTKAIMCSSVSHSQKRLCFSLVL